jgi:hypothetical protein
LLETESDCQTVALNSRLAREENIKTYEHETYHDADLGMNWILMGFKRSSIHNI